MKRILVFSLLSCTLLVACAPQKRQTTYAAPYGYGSETDVVPGADTIPPEVAPGSAVAPVPTPPPAPAPAATPLPKKREAVYGIPEAGKPGFMRSPYNPSAGLIDHRGLPPATEVKDPYTPGKIILVP